ncbi:putative 2-aminoethylphosphonate ABC transporter substrate-binding protein [Cohnella herbarum]|uniref:Putative 2-aminoethylphosphonate ABC transporter substrate-binding protein n=1 Tax=Cohnella herbarum TaxID=2728023 RepID=A0A7Z2ZK55_9BACL|nr:putative 2-aminoethylphosphonate ABC transporter substrate-binding protein [Cohnella herbarum]QJD81757.1 putative 2-aminoethylphosphonate ABC transporter substrate-binding protein [Cohnella herbarum]
MKKQLITMLAIILTFTILAACGKTEVANNNANNSASNNGAGTEAQSSAPASENPEGAKIDEESKELTVYTALEDDIIQAYLVSFKEKYPDVKLNFVRDSTGIITAKLLAEKDNPQADLVWGLAATSLLVLDQNGMLEGYSPEGVDRVLPEFKDSNEPTRWVGIDAWETAFVVNKPEMEKLGLAIPQSYEDLIKPEYKGLITMPNPSSSGTGFLTVSGVLQLMGQEKGWEYLDKLNENIAMYVHSGSKPAKLSGTGEYPIGISFGYRGIQEAQKGSPVETVFPTEGSGWDLEANALIKKGTIKKAAQQFLDWAIGEEVMKEYNKNYAILSVKSDSTVIPEGYSKDPMDQLIPIDLSEAAKNREHTLTEWDKRYNAKSEPKT